MTIYKMIRATSKQKVTAFNVKFGHDTSWSATEGSLINENDPGRSLRRFATHAENRPKRASVMRLK